MRREKEIVKILEQSDHTIVGPLPVPRSLVNGKEARCPPGVQPGGIIGEGLFA